MLGSKLKKQPNLTMEVSLHKFLSELNAFPQTILFFVFCGFSVSVACFIPEIHRKYPSAFPNDFANTARSLISGILKFKYLSICLNKYWNSNLQDALLFNKFSTA